MKPGSAEEERKFPKRGSASSSSPSSLETGEEARSGGDDCVSESALEANDVNDCKPPIDNDRC